MSPASLSPHPPIGPKAVVSYNGAQAGPPSRPVPSGLCSGCSGLPYASTQTLPLGWNWPVRSGAAFTCPPELGVGRCRPVTIWMQDDFPEDGETLSLLNFFQGRLQLKRRSPRGSLQGQGWPGHRRQRSFGDTSIGWGVESVP